MIFQRPELKIGEGGGCMTSAAVEKMTRSAAKKARFAREVIQAVSTSHSPTCTRTPTMAKVSASRKRGSARNNPFQLACMAHSDSGR